MDFIMVIDIWDVIDRPYRCTFVGCKWIFKKKFRSDGIIEKYKA
ncbi:hypothetical protein EHS16_00625 [Streptococcus anginosus]|nr:hypothetical protein EHS16_00625 [Streptococcus anginosus]